MIVAGVCVAYLLIALWITRKLYVRGVTTGKMFNRPVEKNGRRDFLACTAFLGVFWPGSGIIVLVSWWFTAPLRKIEKAKVKAAADLEAGKTRLRNEMEKYLEMGLGATDPTEKQLFLDYYADLQRRYNELYPRTDQPVSKQSAANQGLDNELRRLGNKIQSQDHEILRLRAELHNQRNRTWQ